MKDSKTIIRPYDTHHCLWPRREWNKGYAKGLRTHWYFMVTIPRKTLHAKIHEEMGCIPVPPGQAAREAFEKIMALESYGGITAEDPIEKRLELLASIFRTTSPETAIALNKQAGIVRRFYVRPP